MNGMLKGLEKHLCHLPCSLIVFCPMWVLVAMLMRSLLGQSQKKTEAPDAAKSTTTPQKKIVMLDSDEEDVPVDNAQQGSTSSSPLLVLKGE